MSCHLGGTNASLRTACRNGSVTSFSGAKTNLTHQFVLNGRTEAIAAAWLVEQDAEPRLTGGNFDATSASRTIIT